MSERDCARVRNRIAGYREGWLGGRERARIERHLSGCSSCAREARRDAALSAALGAVSAAAAPPAVWRAPVAPRPLPARLRPAWALASGLLAVLLGWAAWMGLAGWGGSRAPGEAPAPAVVAARDEQPFLAAHALVSMGDVSLDPNRAVVLYALQTDPERSP